MTTRLKTKNNSNSTQDASKKPLSPELVKMIIFFAELSSNYLLQEFCKKNENLSHKAKYRRSGH